MLAVFVAEPLDDLLLDTLPENVGDNVGVFVSVLLPVVVREITPVLDVVELSDAQLDGVACSDCDPDGLELTDTLRVIILVTEAEDEMLSEPEGLFEAEVVTESVYVSVCTGDSVERNDCDAKELNVFVTDTVLVTPVGNVVGLVVNVLSTDPVTETETDRVLTVVIE